MKCINMWASQIFGGKQSETNQGSNQMKHFISITAIIVIAFSVISNILLIYCLYKDRRPLSITKKLFIYLSIVDLLTALVMETGKVYVVYAPEDTPCQFPNLVHGFGNFLNTYSIIIFGTISVLRCISIKKPLLRIKNRIVYIILLMAAVISISIGGTIGNPSVFHLVDDHILKWLRIVASSGILFVVIIVFIMNVMSYAALGKQFNGGTVVSSGSSTNPCQAQLLEIFPTQRKRRAAKTFILITFSYLFCYLPYVTFMYLGGRNKGSITERLVLLHTLHSLMLTNSGLNSIIYMLRMKEIGRYFKCYRNT